MLDPTWPEAIEAFLAHERASGKPVSSLNTYRNSLLHAARRLPATPWETTGPELVHYAQAQQWARETRRSRRQILLNFYRWGVQQGHCATVVAEALPPVKTVPPHARPCPDAVYAAALMAAPPRERLMLRMAAELGMRRAEVAQAQQDDLYDDGRGYSLVVHGKGQRQRIVPVPRSLALELTELGFGFFFPGEDDGHLSPRWVGKRMTQLLPEAWTMHSLRHRFATQAYAARSDLILVQEMLGHSSPNTTRRYVEYDRTRMRDVIEELARPRFAS